MKTKNRHIKIEEVLHMKHIYLTFLSTLIFFGCTSSQTDVAFEWGFEEGISYHYKYTQTTNSKIVIENQKDEQNEATVESNLVINCLSDSSANLSFNATKLIANEEQQAMPDLPPQKMTQRGVFLNKNKNDMFAVFLPLPKVDLKEGETDIIPLEMPFFAFNKSFVSKGENKIKFVDFVTIKGRKCAQLECDIIYNDPVMEEPYATILKCNGKGSAICFFDIEQKIFVKNQIDLTLFSKYDETTEMEQYTSVSIELME